MHTTIQDHQNTVVPSASLEAAHPPPSILSSLGASQTSHESDTSPTPNTALPDGSFDVELQELSHLMINLVGVEAHRVELWRTVEQQMLQLCKHITMAEHLDMSQKSALLAFFGRGRSGGSNAVQALQHTAAMGIQTPRSPSTPHPQDGAAAQGQALPVLGTDFPLADLELAQR